MKTEKEEKLKTRTNKGKEGREGGDMKEREK